MLCIKKNEIIVEIEKVNFLVVILTFTIKVLITLIEKTLLLKVALLIGNGNFIGVLIFGSLQVE